MKDLSEEARSFGYVVPKFAPHITLTSGIEHSSVLDKIESSVPVNETQFEISTAQFNSHVFFKSVVLETVLTPALTSFIKYVRTVFTSEQNIDAWMENLKPHLSLLYADIDFEKEVQLKQNLKGIIDEHSLSAVKIQDLTLQLVECIGPIEKWRVLESRSVIKFT